MIVVKETSSLLLDMYAFVKPKTLVLVSTVGLHLHISLDLLGACNGFFIGTIN